MLLNIRKHSGSVTNARNSRMSSHGIAQLRYKDGWRYVETVTVFAFRIEICLFGTRWIRGFRRLSVRVLPECHHQMDCVLTTRLCRICGSEHNERERLIGAKQTRINCLGQSLQEVNFLWHCPLFGNADSRDESFLVRNEREPNLLYYTDYSGEINILSSSVIR
ncbi:hypothetical protein GOBAR_DD29353 [Gossypium barbadense]|nr:hypothetical protein GOBAR_DD29353 [Gossypium barbadense]